MPVDANQKAISVWTKTLPDEAAVNELAGQLQGFSPALLLAFCSTRYNPNKIAALLSTTFPMVPIIGCTTNGEHSNDYMGNESFVLMGLGHDLLEEVHVSFVEDISKNPLAVDQAVQNLESSLRKPLGSLSPTEYVGLVLMDGMSIMEEKILAQLGEHTSIQFPGGSAADDYCMSKTWVFCGARCHDNAMALAVLKPKVPFLAMKTQSLKTMGIQVVATKANEERRMVHEINGKPAALEYARLLGAPLEDLHEYFNINSLGAEINGEIYVRCPLGRESDHSLTFACKVPEGVPLELMAFQDIPATTQADYQAAIKQLGSVSAVVQFNCSSRCAGLEARGQYEEYGKIFAGVPHGGFCTYGEALRQHINNTSVLLLFAQGQAH